MKRSLALSALLSASLLLAACDHKAEKVSTYDPALDGPTPPTTPVNASALMEGKVGGGVTTDTPAPKPVATKPAAAVPAETAASNPAEPPVEAPSAGVDTAKTEIETRLAQIKQMLTDEKFDEYERAGTTPEELKVKTDADADFLAKEAAKDKADPAKPAASLEALIALVKATKPTISADGLVAGYRFPEGSAMPAAAFKKVDGVWYYSDVETSKLSAPATVPAPAPAP